MLFLSIPSFLLNFVTLCTARPVFGDPTGQIPARAPKYSGCWVSPHSSHTPHLFLAYFVKSLITRKYHAKSLKCAPCNTLHRPRPREGQKDTSVLTSLVGSSASGPGRNLSRHLLGRHTLSSLLPLHYHGEETRTTHLLQNFYVVHHGFSIWYFTCLFTPLKSSAHRID